MVIKEIVNNRPVLLSLHVVIKIFDIIIHGKMQKRSLQIVFYCFQFIT